MFVRPYYPPRNCPPLYLPDAAGGDPENAGMIQARFLCISLALAWCVGSISARAGAGVTFERDVRPIFKEYCLDCHGGGESIKGKLDLRLKRFVERGGKSGPAIVAGKPEESYLLARLNEREMPPGEKKVPPEKIAVIERWIAGGAATLRAEPERLSPGIDITPEERAFWAFQPIRRPRSARVSTAGYGSDADRCVRPGQTPHARSDVRSRSRQVDPYPPRDV